MTAITENPELMTQYAFVEAKGRLLRDAGIEGVDSLFKRMERQSEHLLAVRDAINERRPIHVDNLLHYKRLFPALRQYSINGNLAVYDSAKVMATLEDQRRALAYESIQDRKERDRR